MVTIYISLLIRLINYKVVINVRNCCYSVHKCASVVVYLVVQPTERMLSGRVSLAPFRKSFALSGIVVAFTGPGRMSALRNTGNISWMNKYFI